MKYFDNLKKSMTLLGSHRKTIFIGQAVEYEGTAMTKTLIYVNKRKLLELPVAEEMQMGITLGLALDGFIPISIFPRWNFIMCAMNQLVNHLDKISSMSNKKFKTKMIIRTSIGSKRPLDPHCQHVGDFTEVVKKMCPNLEVLRLNEPEIIIPSYKKALNRKDGKSTILVEYGDYYNEK
jgi:pyruvate/2-oxoglutarate/acetoin dehydrogenase E1 component